MASIGTAKSALCLSSLTALMLAGSGADEAAAQTPSARHCATQRALGRYPAGCPRPRQQPPRVRPSAPAQPPAAALSRGAMAIRAALDAVPESEWLTSDNEIFSGIERRVQAVGTLADLEALARSGNRRAQYLAGRAHSNGTFGAARDAARALQWYRRAAQLGDPLAQSFLGGAYRSGTGVTQDDAEAVRWFRRSAEAGYSYGMDNLGWMYQQGRGVTRDDAEAVRWFRRAAGLANPAAMSNLAYMYATGRGIARDDGEALRWYRRAAEAGFEHARQELARRGVR